MQIGGPQQLAQPGIDSVRDNSAPQGLAGKASNGEKVLVLTNAPSPMAQAADIAEEITSLRSQFKDDLKDRKVKKGDDLSQKILERVQKIQTIQNAQEIKDFLQNLKSNPNLTREQLEEQLGEFSDDVLHQFMGLDIASNFFKDSGDEEKANLLKEVRNEFFKENKTAIKSGINISEVAAKQAEETGISNTRELRETHVKLLDHVRDHKTLEDAFVELEGTHGKENFKTAVEIQLKLLSTDLLSFNPSTSNTRLKAVIDDLSSLKVLSGFYDGCLETEEQITRIFPETTVAEQVLMKEMLSLLQQQWVTETDFDKLPDMINVSDLEAQIFTMTKIVGLVRMLPEEIFANIETKQNMFAAASESLDGKIEQEAEDEMGDVIGPDESSGILGEVTMAIGLGENQDSPLADSVNDVSQSAQRATRPKIGTADYIAAKAMKQLPGEEYKDSSEIITDIHKLAGKPEELQRLLDYMDSLKNSEFEYGNEAEQLEKYTIDLLDMSKLNNGLHSTNPRNVTVRGG